jgi:hypothetical protein
MKLEVKDDVMEGRRRRVVRRGCIPLMFARSY